MCARIVEEGLCSQCLVSVGPLSAPYVSQKTFVISWNFPTIMFGCKFLKPVFVLLFLTLEFCPQTLHFSICRLLPLHTPPPTLFHMDFLSPKTYTLFLS